MFPYRLGATMRAKRRKKRRGKKLKQLGNKPTRYRVVTGDGKLVSKTGSLGAARDDRERAKRHGKKGVKVVDTQKRRRRK